MPIYEFYCADCNTLFNFFAPRVDTQSRPLCPRCGKIRLERRPARFATLKRTGEGDEEDDLFSGLDERRLEGAMDSLVKEMEGMSGEEDPRQMARLFRRFSEVAGIEPGPRLEEMLRRLDAGEDPETMEEEMEAGLGDDEESLEEFFRFKKVLRSRRSGKPAVDETLYFL